MARKRSKKQTGRQLEENEHEENLKVENEELDADGSEDEEDDEEGENEPDGDEKEEDEDDDNEEDDGDENDKGNSDHSEEGGDQNSSSGEEDDNEPGNEEKDDESQEEVVQAATLAPNIFGESSELAASRREDVNFDLHNLCCSDTHPVELDKLRKGPEKHLLDLTTENAQDLIHRLFDLPAKSSEVGPIAELPGVLHFSAPGAMRLPREKRLPELKEETRWEKFAREKGIRKTQAREKMVWDEATGKYRPRFGYQRGGEDHMDHPIVEVKEGHDPLADPWTAKKVAKKGRVAKNMLQQMKNQLHAGNTRAAPAGIPVDLVSATARSVASARAAGTMKPVLKRGRDKTEKTLRLVQNSTASMGKFDEVRQGEPEKKARQGKRRKFQPLLSAQPKAESQAQLKTVQAILVNKGKSKSQVSHQSKSDLAVYDAIEGEKHDFRKRKGRAGAGKMKKVTKKRGKA